MKNITKRHGIKTLLANRVSTLFINGKPAIIDVLRKSINPPSWLVVFVVVPFIKISVFSKDLITFTISFISLFVRVIPEPVIDEIPFLIFLPIKLSPVSRKILLFF